MALKNVVFSTAVVFDYLYEFAAILSGKQRCRISIVVANYDPGGDLLSPY